MKVKDFLSGGGLAHELKIDFGATTLKRLLAQWIALALPLITVDDVTHAWDGTGLSKAWDGDVQTEARHHANRQGCVA